MNNNPYKEGTQEFNDWNAGFKVGLQGFTYSSADRSTPFAGGVRYGLTQIAGTGRNGAPIRCITTDRVYESIKQAAKANDLSLKTLSDSLNRDLGDPKYGWAKGLLFERIEENKEAA